MAYERLPLEPRKTRTQIEDEVINVTLPKADYEILRDMITKQKSLNWIGKYIRSVLLVAVGGIVTLISFGDQIKHLIELLLGVKS